MQRFGGDSTARRKLLAERKRLKQLLRELATTGAVEFVDRAKEDLHKVRTALREVKTTVNVTELKTARSRRTIALPSVAVRALRTHRVRQLEARLVAGGRWADGDFVFASSTGTPMDPRNVTRQFKALLKEAELPDMRLHDLRHSCATLLLAQGVDPRTIMETLGHSQISLTLNTYSHVLPALKQEAALKMDIVLGGS
ncbi:MAG: site-specific integrase [Gemmatimonadetes bacterium]|nr:site-specific integrase [Gemmatimonadota bacterium]